MRNRRLRQDAVSEIEDERPSGERLQYRLHGVVQFSATERCVLNNFVRRNGVAFTAVLEIERIADYRIQRCGECLLEPIDDTLD